MLRIIIIGVLLYGAYVVGSYISSEYKKAEKKSGESQVEQPAPAPVPSSSLPGMPPQLAASLDAAEARGPVTFKKWLEANRKYLRDPKLGDIELDYAVAVARQNSAEAKAVYADVKARTPANSPLQPRLKRLATTFE
jgi:hypothetical protein